MYGDTDSNAFKSVIPAKRPALFVRPSVDDRRSGNTARDGFTVHDQAMKEDRWGGRSKIRAGVGVDRDDPYAVYSGF